MEEFANKYFKYAGRDLKVLDVGSMDVNGSYRTLFGCHYFGIDITDGQNVDKVVEPYNWDIEDESFDIVISGQTLEHVKFFWLTMQEIERVLKKGGLVCLIVPAEVGKHRYPVDCWRMLEDGMHTLAEWVNLEVIEAYTTNTKNSYIYTIKDNRKKKRRRRMGDSVLIARKLWLK